MPATGADWLEPPWTVTPPRLRALITEPSESHDISEPTEAAEARLNADANEPTDPIDSAEPTEPMDRIEPWLPMESTEPSDPRDQSDGDMFATLTAAGCASGLSGARFHQVARRAYPSDMLGRWPPAILSTLKR